MKFRKTALIEATQWFKMGDHPEVVEAVKRPDGVVFLHNQICEDGGAGYAHTFGIFSLEGAHEVKPGDWIIKGIKGEHYACNPEIFAMTYEPAEQPQSPAEPKATSDVMSWDQFYDLVRPLVRELIFRGPGDVLEAADTLRAKLSAPEFFDNYVGVRDSMESWKLRALAAEAKLAEPKPLPDEMEVWIEQMKFSASASFTYATVQSVVAVDDLRALFHNKRLVSADVAGDVADYDQPAFEAYAKLCRRNLVKNADGDYIEWATHLMWSAWRRRQDDITKLYTRPQSPVLAGGVVAVPRLCLWGRIEDDEWRKTQCGNKFDCYVNDMPNTFCGWCGGKVSYDEYETESDWNAALSQSGEGEA